MIMIPISVFLDLGANAEYSVTALMKLPHNFDKKWSLFVLRAYSAVLKVRVVQFYNWFVVIFNFCIMGGGGCWLQYSASYIEFWHPTATQASYFPPTLLELPPLLLHPRPWRWGVPIYRIATSPINSPARHHMLYVWSNHLS